MAGVKQKHGWSRTREYKAIADAISRCHNEKHPSYYLYGALGISVCDEWRMHKHRFCEYLGKAPDGMSLDRIDPAGNYEPGNVKWATPSEQVQNRKKVRSNTTGTTGVSWLYNQKKNKYAAAWWTNLEGEAKCKTFSVIKYGEELAFKLACEYRTQIIQELNNQGAKYSEHHGK